MEVKDQAVAAFRQGLSLEVRDPGRGPKAGRLLPYAGDTQKNTRTCPLPDGRGGAHTDAPRWQEKGTSSLLSATSKIHSELWSRRRPLCADRSLFIEEADALLSQPPSSRQQDSESTGGIARMKSYEPCSQVPTRSSTSFLAQ